MVDADRAPSFALVGLRLDRVQIDQGDAVMFVVVGQEGENGILVLDLAIEDRAVPFDHLLELARAVHDMDEAGRADA